MNANGNPGNAVVIEGYSRTKGLKGAIERSLSSRKIRGWQFSDNSFLSIDGVLFERVTTYGEGTKFEKVGWKRFGTFSPHALSNALAESLAFRHRHTLPELRKYAQGLSLIHI